MIVRFAPSQRPLFGKVNRPLGVNCGHLHIGERSRLRVDALGLAFADRMLGPQKRTRTNERELRRMDFCYPLRFWQKGAFKQTVGSG